MGRELIDYRNTIEQLNRLFPDVEMLNKTQTMRALGCRSHNTLKKFNVPFVNGRVNKASLARLMCEGMAR